MKLLFVSTLLGASVALLGVNGIKLRGQQTPSVPVWPNGFSISFNETTDYIIDKYHNFGKMYYDWTNRRERTDRSTGTHDRYCGSVISYDTSCTHLVVNGVRYLFWPELPKCCTCCTDAQGCGVVTPTWIADSNHTYVGQNPVNGILSDQWKVQGLQPNYWSQSVGGNIPVQLFQDPDATRDFDLSSYQIGSQPDSIFAIPTIANCSIPCSQMAPLSVCALL